MPLTKTRIFYYLRNSLSLLETKGFGYKLKHILRKYENSTKGNPKQEIALILRNIAQITEARILDDKNKIITLKWNHNLDQPLGHRHLARSLQSPLSWPA